MSSLNEGGGLSFPHFAGSLYRTDRLPITVGLALLIVLVVVPVAHADGPFGVQIGSDPTSMPGCHQTKQPGLWSCSTLPKTHSAFESYAIQSSGQTGVCWIKAIGKDIADNGYGLQVKAKAEEIAKQVASTYGQWTNLDDAIIPDSIWGGAGEWLMAIRQSQRYYAYEWDPKRGFSPKNSVRMIYVAVGATSGSSGFILVEFYGDNYDTCKAAISADEAKSF